VKETGRGILEKTKAKNKRSQVVIPILPISTEDLILKLTMTKRLDFNLAVYDRLVDHYFRLLFSTINENLCQRHLEICLTRFKST